MKSIKQMKRKVSNQIADGEYRMNLLSAELEAYPNDKDIEDAMARLQYEINDLRRRYHGLIWAEQNGAE